MWKAGGRGTSLRPFKHRLLRAMGWRVVSVPFYERVPSNSICTMMAERQQAARACRPGSADIGTVPAGDFNVAPLLKVAIFLACRSSQCYCTLRLFDFKFSRKRLWSRRNLSGCLSASTAASVRFDSTRRAGLHDSEQLVIQTVSAIAAGPALSVSQACAAYPLWLTMT
eukprot:g10213.t1